MISTREARTMYECCGDLDAIANLAGIEVSVLIRTATKRGWDRPPFIKSRKPALVRLVPGASLLARRLNEVDGLSKAKVGKLFGAAESTINLLSTRERWTLGSKAIGQKLTRSLSVREELAIVSRYRRGDSLTEIARDLGYKSNRPIFNIVKAHNSLRAKEIALSEEDVSVIAGLYLEGKGCSSIGAQYGVDASVIANRLKRFGVPVRSMLESNRFIGKIKTDRRRAFAPKGLYLLRDARCLTEVMYAHFKDLINPEDLPRSRDMYHLDHLYPLNRSVYNPSNLDHPINIWEVCHPANLQMLCSLENSRKGARLHITASELRKRIQDWNHEHLDPYAIFSHPLLKQLFEAYGRYDNYLRFGRSSQRRYYQTSNSSSR
jgi:hypothetical protein